MCTLLPQTDSRSRHHGPVMTRGGVCCESGGGSGQMHQRGSTHVPGSHPLSLLGTGGFLRCPSGNSLEALPGIGAEEGAVVLVSPQTGRRGFWTEENI